jgi:hypothetical protein
MKKVPKKSYIGYDLKDNSIIFILKNKSNHEEYEKTLNNP